MQSQMRSPINSQKMVYSSTPFTVTATNISQIQPLIAKQSADVNIAGEVPAGAVVKAIWLEYWATSDDATQGSVVVSVEKTSTNQSSMTYADSIDISNYANKNNVFYVTQGLVNPNTSVATAFVRQWIKLPKGKQRFGVDEKLVINVSSPTAGINMCGVAIYKAYN